MSVPLSSSSAGRRNRQVDTLRGIACILLVAFHVIGYDATNGLQIASGPIREINDLLAHVRMPLFTFLSGIVYAWRPYDGDTGRFLRGKIRRLIIPLLTVGTLFAVIQTIVPGTHAGITNWALLHIQPVGHFWFLEALFIIFVLMIGLESLHLLDTPHRFFAVFLGAILISLLQIPVSWFAFNGMTYLLPFFLAGMAVRRYGLHAHISRRNAVWLLAGMAAVFLFMYLGILDNPDRQTLPAILIGVLTCTGLLQLGWESPWLANIGFFSYAIYLYHVFFTAGIRIALKSLGVDDFESHFLIGLMAGIIGPILLERLFIRHPFWRVLMLGQAPNKPVIHGTVSTLHSLNP